jgi:DNA-binding transcriptional MerR regulator
VIGASAAAENPSGEALMSIGDVLAHLRVDFPDTTISKLRFLEAEGLVEPRRTAAGYRKYSWYDVARLRYVLTAQRDNYLPLRVIRDQLAHLDAARPESTPAESVWSESVRPDPVRPDSVRPDPVRPDPVRAESVRYEPTRSGPAWSGPARSGVTRIGGSAADAGERGDGRMRPNLVSLPDHPPEPAIDPGDVRVSRAELITRSGLTPQTLTALEQYGLLKARPGGGFDADAVEVAMAAGQLAEYGLEARHLRAYRAAADREVGLFSQLVAPLARQSGPAARARAAETVRELAACTERLHAALVRGGLRETLGR